jgi:hypothetical protein
MEVGIWATKQVGDIITIENAKLFNGYGQETTAQITITVHEAYANGKPFFHVRVQGLLDNHTFSTEVQQQINAVVNDIRERKHVTFTVSHCNGGMGRGPTHMFLDSVERVAHQAHKEGHGCVCDWGQQKSPLVDGKINLAYVARNMALKGNAARHVCGQSTSQFQQVERFTEDIARKYAQAAAV